MTRFIVRRLLILPIALLAINFVAFSYALLAQRVQQAQNPFGSNVDVSVPILSLYRVYLCNVLTGDWGQMPLVGSSAEAVQTVVACGSNGRTQRDGILECSGYLVDRPSATWTLEIEPGGALVGGALADGRLCVVSGGTLYAIEDGSRVGAQ